NQMLQFLGRSVSVVRCICEDTIVAPATCTRKLCNRHQLDSRVSGLDQKRKLVYGSKERAFLGKGTDMQLANDRLAPVTTPPTGILPPVRRWIDDKRRSVYIRQLRSGGGIRQSTSIGQDEAIWRAR